MTKAFHILLKIHLGNHNILKYSISVSYVYNTTPSLLISKEDPQNLAYNPTHDYNLFHTKQTKINTGKIHMRQNPEKTKCKFPTVFSLWSCTDML